MKIHILMTGPIRPSEFTVLDVVSKMKEQLPDAYVHLFTWKGSETNALRNVVDTLHLMDEIPNSQIHKLVTTKSREYMIHLEEGRIELAEARFCNLFRMIHGVSTGIKTIDCEDDDIVIRTRTDCVFLFKPEYLVELIERAKNAYVVRSRRSSDCMFDDWFAITSCKILKRVWCMWLEEYNHLFKISLNAEDMIRRRCDGIQIVRMDESKIEAFLYREDNLTRFYLE